MSAPQLFTKGIAYVNGNQLTMETSMTIKRTSGAQDVKTVSLQWAGVSPGAGMTEITVKNAVPSAAFEFNPGPFIQNLQKATMTFYIAGATMSLDGFIMEDTFNHAVDTEGTIEFVFHGPLVDFD